LVLTLVACTQRQAPNGQSVTIGLETSPLSLDPRLARDAASARVLQLLFNGLVKKDRAAHLLPDLAEAWETPSPTTYIFHLRTGVRFHDGTVLTADDVKATFDTIRDPAFKSPKGGSFAQIREITVVDPDTIRFDLAEPFAPFLLNLTTGIVPRASVERLGAEFAERPIGTGPFRFQRWEPDARLELVSHRDYFEGPPKLDRLVYKIVPDPTVRVLELEKGTIDLLQNDIPPDLLPRLQGNPRLTVLKEAGTNYAYLGFNLRDPILQQRQIRQAIAYAIHRREIISHVLKGLATPAAGILPPTHWAYAPDLPSYDYDPERARRLLDAAGYPAPKGGAPRFHLALKISQNDLQRRVAEALQAQLKAVGIAITLNSFEWGTFFAHITSGTFQLYTLSWVGVTDPDIFSYILHQDSVPPKGANRGYYLNREVSALIERGRSTLEPDARTAAYQAIQRIMAADLPYVSLWFSTNVAAMRADLEGFELYPAGDLTSLRRVYRKGQPYTRTRDGAAWRE
jgi:peptide/nickel transport system substrate-binding protein